MLYLVLGGVTVLAVIVLLLVRQAKSAGAATAQRDTLAEGEERREAFDEAVDRPLARGSELIARLRQRVGR